MIFLLQYDRRKGRIVSLDSFSASERTKAQDLLLELELRQNENGANTEIVMLEAESEEALKITHRHYFEDLSELVKPPAELREPLLRSR